MKRLGRKQFWISYAGLQITSALVSAGSYDYTVIPHLIIVTFFILTAICRMHDVGKSGWFILVPFYSLYLYCKKGDEFGNKYGMPTNDYTLFIE